MLQPYAVLFIPTSLFSKISLILVNAIFFWLILNVIKTLEILINNFNKILYYNQESIFMLLLCYFCIFWGWVLLTLSHLTMSFTIMFYYFFFYTQYTLHFDGFLFFADFDLFSIDFIFHFAIISTVLIATTSDQLKMQNFLITLWNTWRLQNILIGQSV